MLNFLVIVALILTGAIPSLPQAQAPEAGKDRVALGDVTFFSTGEGTLLSQEIEGRTGWMATGHQRLLYGDLRSVKSPHVRLSFTVNDGGYKGAIAVPYDSSDEIVRVEANNPGAWKSSALVLPGGSAWTTVTLEWPDARLAKRCNGHDFRLQFPSPANVLVADVRVEELGPLPAAPGPGSLPLSPLPAPGADVDGDRVRLPGEWKQRAGAPILMNAADATTVTLLPGRSFGSEGVPAGGRSIQDVENASYRFTVVTSGRYQLWERAFFPGHGYNHDENVDNKQRFNIIDDTKDTPLNGWIWVKAGLYDLAAGLHTFSLQYHGGARLDRLVFSPDLQNPPMGDGGPPSQSMGPASATVQTADAQPMDVARWLQIESDIDPRGGGVDIALSGDGGASWKPAPVDMNLQNFKALGRGQDRLRLRLTLRRAPDGSSPIIQNLHVQYAPGPHDQMVLADKELQIAFGPAGVRRFTSTALNTDFVHTAAPHPLFQLYLKPPGSAPPVWALSTQAVVLGRLLIGNVLVQRFRLPEGIDVTCRVTLSGSNSRWGIAIDNHSPLEVCAVQYPMLGGVRVGSESADDTLAAPVGSYQQVIRNPVGWSINWESRGPAMHWMYLYDGRAGLYLGDENWPSNDLILVAQRQDPTTLKFGLTREYLVAPGTRRDSPDYVVAVRPGGDWHPGADIYRAWAADHLKKPVLPAWTARMDGWAGANSNDFPVRGISVINDDQASAQRAGLGFYMGGNRGQIDGPIEYVGMWPAYCPAYGSLREYQDAHREIREMGGHTNWYFNWQLLSPSRVIERPRIAGIIPRGWIQHPIEWPDKNWYRNTALRWYGWGELSTGSDGDELVQSAASPDWQQHHYDRTRDWVERYGSDGMYYDQLSVPSQIASLDPAYNKYGDYGVWERAVQDNLQHITEDMRRVDPHFVSSGELSNAVLGQSVSFHMTSGAWNHFEILKYCVPEQQNLDGVWNGGLDAGYGGKERWRFVWLAGARFEQPYDELGQQYLALRHRVNQLLYPARFMDTVGLTLTQNGKPVANPAGDVHGQKVATGPELAQVVGPQARWFLLAQPNRGALINVLQEPPAPGPPPRPLTISIPTASFGPVKAAWTLNLDGSTHSLQGTESNGRYSFTLDSTQKGVTVLLINQVAPQTDLDLPFAGAPGSTMHGTASLTYYGPTPATGTLDWQLPGGWRGTAGRARLLPGKTARIPVSLTLPPTGIGRRVDLTLRAGAAVSPGASIVLPFPHWVTITDPLWVRLERESEGQVEATIFNRSDRPLTGRILFSAPGGVQLTPSGQTFAVGPWASAVVRTLLSGMEPLQKPIHLEATATAGGNLTARRSLMLYPPAPNGDFETDSAGDGKADWWYASVSSAFDLSLNNPVMLDAQAPYSGKFCLRLDPHPTPGRGVTAQPIVNSIDGGHRYHLRAAIRKTAAADDAFLSIQGQRLSTDTAGRWVVIETTFDVPAGGRGTDLSLNNYSRNPVWFDAISIKKVDR